jgi:hypothetical protein
VPGTRLGGLIDAGEMAVVPGGAAEPIETGEAMIPSRSPVALRLGKLAEAARTGSLDLSGDSGGVIYVSGGDIVAADSRRTPSLAARTRTEEAGSLEWTWLAREATVDAAMDLMSVRPRHVRFSEPGEEPPPGLPAIPGMPVTVLIAEVTRRHRLLEQIAAVLTPDAAVARNPRLRSRAVRVSDRQWAILTRLGRAGTPRDLALELGQSVFGTTIEVYRMVVMDLVSVAGTAVRPAEPAGPAGRIWPALSFVRALA